MLLHEFICNYMHTCTYNTNHIHILATVTLSVTPESKNVTVGTEVTFSCATPEKGLLFFFLETTPPLGTGQLNTLPNGDQMLTRTVVTKLEYTKIIVTCTAFKHSNAYKLSTAYLMVQGEITVCLTSYMHCTCILCH